jgi:threonine dehydrogenase-like Zn-dependent dehydrogenase
MKAVAVFSARREVQLIEHQEPGIQSPTQIKVRVLDVGVCGTDREITSFQYGTPPDGSDYLIIGHESLNQVIECGETVTRAKPGDLVVLTVRRPCPHASCIACRSERQDYCYTGDFTERGIKQRHGYMTEFVVEEEIYANVVPPELREVAVLVEPLTIAEKSLEQLRTVEQRLPWDGQGHRNAVVLGAGPVGLLGAMALRGGKGAAIGALAGGAAGAVGQLATRGKRVHVPAESVLTFQLRQPLELVPDRGYTRDGQHYHPAK